MQLSEKRLLQYIRSTERALSEYTLDEPFARFLTLFFKNNRQMGSTDRKMISRFCYNFFRIGNAASSFDWIDRLTIAEFLCTEESAVVSYYKPQWEHLILESTSKKIQFLVDQQMVSPEDVFPRLASVSADIEVNDFIAQQFTQPKLFIRVKRGEEGTVIKALQHHNILFEQLEPQILSFENGTKLSLLKELHGLYEVQDYSSQKTLDDVDPEEGDRWWDACAGSGGKSLMFLDRYPNIELWASDERLSVLKNLEKRFSLAGTPLPKHVRVVDLRDDVSSVVSNELFDGIILDVPCSGSGTWSRTPERKLQYVDLNKFVDLQQSILRQVTKCLKPEKPLIYITCSVYKEENEGMVEFMVQELGLQLQSMRVLSGYDKAADTMFVAKLLK